MALGSWILALLSFVLFSCFLYQKYSYLKSIMPNSEIILISISGDDKPGVTTAITGIQGNMMPPYWTLVRQIYIILFL